MIMKTKSSENLNWGTKLLLLVCAISIFSTVNWLQLPDRHGLPLSYTMTVSILEALSLMLILLKKKIGIFSFFFLQTMTIITALIAGREKMMFYILSSIAYCIFLALILGLRNEGKSGWGIIFKPEVQGSKEYASMR